jgi:tRNA threonylcarbamoyladenosine biosynthesis protein TsaE
MTEAELVRWGEALGRDVHPPMIITLVGELGTGKTTLAQAICRGYGVEEEVTSPTYALIHEYAAPKSPVFHIDLYRLESPDELDNMGWDELVTDHALILVEWPERAGDRLPPVHVPITLDYLPDDPTRRVLLAG